MIVLACVLAIFGLFGSIRPDLIWVISESWKSNDATEPSDLYIISTRFGGIVCFLSGIGVIIALAVA
ncbi:hypothetical protein D7Z26_00305 [Cohnella endophytica]|uniref:DUF6199 domain-containing protein n=1 Tax=Cohnella endophytica TaxID=2419778 RepID=A0A494Y5U5_9BACL|nr:DUF6199 family natural product biosynthesis protein [Cohnella endophytica]RKP57992.1 hypothetical protein D7Z26_00305 [Cohnella endophytica]